MGRRNRQQRQQPQRANRPMVSARFDLAQTTPENRRHWTNADGLAARAAISPAVRRVCRIRSRYEAENNSWYAGILRTASNHIVGATGPRLQVLTADVEANRRLEAAWRQWTTKVDLADIIRTCVEAYWRDGEVFIMRGSSVRFPLALDLLVLESDQIATPWQQSQLVDPFVDDGIRFDRATNELEFYVYDHHPGLNTPVSTLKGQWYPAREVCHLFRAERPGQTRGVPRATPALQTLPIMRRQELATLFSAETAANFAMYLKTNSSAVTPATAPADFAEIELTRNMLTTLPEGWDIGQVEPKQPGPLYEMFQRQALMSFCRCTNMPYTLAAGTGKDANFSSFKGDMTNVWQPEVSVEQNRIQTAIVERIWQWFLESAVFVPGLLNGFPAIADIDHRWHWPPLPELDQVEAAQAAEIRLSAGLSTPTEEHARRGKDWDLESARAAADFGVPVEDYRRAVFARTFGLQGGILPPAQQPQTAAASPSGEYMELGQRAYNNNQRRIMRTLDDLATGTITRVMAETSLQTIGLAPERIAALIDDVLPVESAAEQSITAALSDVDLTPSDGMVEEAKRGLAWRREHGRGGTAIGIARARDIANRRKLSPDTVSRMVRFFSRHQGNENAEGFSPGEDGFPSNGRIAWALWSGDAGKTWAESKLKQLRNAREVAR
jgi:lambda family phage portal protein